MSNNPNQFLSEIFTLPFGDIIASVGEGVATAQAAMDHASLESTLAIYSDDADPGLAMLREIGYQPTFYVIPKASGKLQVALSMFSETTEAGTQLRLMASPLNPTLSNKYGHTATASAEVSFDIVPVPPNEQIRRTPNVTGKTADIAAATLRDLGLGPTFVDAAGLSVEAPAQRAVTLQAPPAGTIVKIGTEMTLTV
jgi:hypothetical protein